MEYNVENLFDSRHDTLKNDTEFLPSADRGWNSVRFYRKIKALSKVIWAASGDYAPDLIGLCEVENDFCMRTLTHYSALSDVGYRYVMTQSQDERGMDVALMYQPASFGYLGHECLRVNTPYGFRPTRDLLHVYGRVLSGDTLDIFVVHFPSRINGEKASEPYRLKAAERLRHAVDSLVRVRRKALQLVMGDFNDYSSNRALVQVLCSGKDGLIDLTAGIKEGTYKYKGEWGMLDHVLVSASLLEKDESLKVVEGSCKVLRLPFLLQEDDVYGGFQPFRTYRGMRYQGGFSDHLPLRFELECVNP